MKRFLELIKDCLSDVREIMPWDLEERLQANPDLLLLDVREPYEFDAMHIPNSVNVPRGILESACEWDFEETIPELVQAREREIVVVCRSGYRSVLACSVMQLMGYRSVVSLKTGIKGWNDYDQPLFDAEDKMMDGDDAWELLNQPIREDQKSPE